MCRRYAHGVPREADTIADSGTERVRQRTRAHTAYRNVSASSPTNGSRKSVSEIHRVSRVMKKSHTLISIYADEAPGTILELFLMKTLSEPRTEGASPCL